MWLVWTATLTCLLLSRRWRRWRLVSRPPGSTPTSWCSRWSWLWWGCGSEEWSKSLKIAYLCPDAGKQGIIDLPEFPFALEPRVSTRWKRPTRIQTEFLGQTFLYVVFFINSTWGAWMCSSKEIYTKFTNTAFICSKKRQYSTFFMKCSGGICTNMPVKLLTWVFATSEVVADLNLTISGKSI